jgi:hypothetical protein
MLWSQLSHEAISCVVPFGILAVDLRFNGVRLPDAPHRQRVDRRLDQSQNKDGDKQKGADGAIADERDAVFDLGRAVFNLLDDRFHETCIMEPMG